MKPNVIEAREDSFQNSVVERSHQRPVLVDFWAPWCGPCRMLTPVLEELAAEGEGSWLLAKVNTDENPSLAARYGVRGIPNVKLFKGGEIVDEFVGAQPRPMVQQFLQKWVASKAEKQIEEAEAEIEGGNLEAARASLEALQQAQPGSERLRLALARLDLAEGNSQAALSHLDAIPRNGPLGAEATRLRAQCNFAGEQPDALDELRARASEDPGNLDARFELARAEAARGDYDSALEDFLGIIEEKRDYRDGAAHRAMLDLFALLGDEDPRTQEYRRQLGWLLFS